MYNKEGYITKMVDGDIIKTYQYNYTANKVSHVYCYNPQTKELSWVQYHYDAKANLIFVEEISGSLMRLSYDSKNRMVECIDQNGDWVRFTYGNPIFDTKPTIIDSNKGTITTIFNDKGEPDKVETSGGEKIEIRNFVTSHLNRLTELTGKAST